MTPHVVPRASVSVNTAQRMIDRALKYADEIGKDVSVAVVDEGGFLVAFARADRATASSVQIAIDKAYTAAVTRIATHKWQETVEDDLPLRYGAAAAVDRLVVFGGGQPIVVDGEVVGAIGSSGGHWTGDTDITSAALGLLDEEPSS